MGTPQMAEQSEIQRASPFPFSFLWANVHLQCFQTQKASSSHGGTQWASFHLRDRQPSAHLGCDDATAVPTDQDGLSLHKQGGNGPPHPGATLGH